MARQHLITGGAGFIGSHLCDALLAAGDSVTVVDNFSTGRASNIAHLAAHPGFAVVEHDITEPLPAELTGRPFDTVLHLASPASPVDFRTMPIEILEVGSIGTRNMLRLATEQQARFLLASTSEVYGDPEVHPQVETYRGSVDPVGPRSCYDESKRFAEAITMAFHRAHGTDVRIVRIFNTYGERMRPDDGRVVTNFVMAALRGEPLVLYGDGTRTRSFCYVADEVAGIRAVLDGPLRGPVNVGGDDEVQLLELARLVLELTGSHSELAFASLPPERGGDPNRRRPDLTLVREQLGWRASTSLRDGLRRAVDWYRTTDFLG